MTSNRLKNLARIRLILSVIAVLLAGLMIVSGIIHFRPVKPAAEEPAESAPGTIATTVPETTAATETVAPTTETAVNTESTQPGDEHIQLQPEQIEVKRPSSENSSPEEGGNWPKEDTSNNTTGSGSSDTTTPDNDTPITPDSGPSINPDGESNFTPDSGSSVNPAGESNSTPDSGSSINPAGESNSTPDSGSSVNPDGESNSTPDSGSSVNPAGESNSTPDSGSSVNPTGEPNSDPDNGNDYSGAETNNNSFGCEDEHYSSDANAAPSENHFYLYQNAQNTQTYTEETNQTESSPLTEEPAQAEIPTQTEALIQTEDPVQTEVPTLAQFSENDDMDIWGILFWTSAALLSIDLLAILFVSNAIQKELRLLNQKLNRQTHHTVSTTIVSPVPTSPQIASIHQVGQRNYQQDSLGHTSVLGGQGLLAVLADGMGGLTNGDKVSQKIVLDALAIGNDLKPDQVNGCLWKMVDKINENANRMLGSDGIYKSGSTLVAALAYNGRFQWISVGDSRIYLYRKGYANQLNQDHDQLQVLMADVLSGRLTMEEALRDPDRRKLTSFIGMGQLKYVDGSCHAISLEAGDRLILMSDGVYTIIGEDRLADILKRHSNVHQAVSVIERIIRDNNHPQQDNYTAIILGF